MIKHLKTAFFIILYPFIYLLLNLVCQIALGLTIGGAGSGLAEIFAASAFGDQESLNEAANLVANNINIYVSKNTGLIFSISALLSLLVFIKIYSVRKLSLFSLLRMDCKPHGADMLNGAFAGASANFVISLVVVALQGLGLFAEAFSQHEAHMEATFGTGGTLAMLLGVGLIIPLVEEVMFRGMVMHELGRVAPWKAVIIIQGLVFGLYHFVPVQIFYTAPLGAYFGYIVYKTGTVWPAVAGHMAMNSIGILLASPGAANMSGEPMFTYLYILISSYMFIKALIFFIKKKPLAQNADENGP